MAVKVHIQSWNANGILNKLQEFREYLITNKVDVMFVNELKIAPTVDLSTRGYTTYIHRRPNSNHGGVAVLIKHGIPHKKLIRVQNTIENAGILLQDGTAIIGVYNSPQNQFTNNCLDNILNTANKVVLIGDFNAVHETWNCNRRNANGNTLRAYLDTHNQYKLHHTQEHTHFPFNNTTPTTIDLMITKHITDHTDLETAPDLSSDHNPIFFNLYIQGQQTGTRTIISYANANWNQYRSYINNNIIMQSQISDTRKLEEAVDRFTGVLTAGKKLVSKTIHTNKDQLLPKNITDLIKLRNRYKKLWQAHRIQTDKSTMIELNQSIKTAIKDHKQQTWTRKLTNLTPSDNSLWKIVKAFKNKIKPIPTFEQNNNKYYTDKSKANLLAEYFESVHRLNPINTPEQTAVEQRAQTLQLINEPTTKETLAKLQVTPAELVTFTKILPNNKAPGADGISYRLLKNLPKKGIVQLMYIVNAIFQLQHWPAQWKIAHIIPIPKQGKDPACHKNYRPISLLSCVGKLVEKVVLDRLDQHTDTLGVNDLHQFGFKRGHNTTQQLSRIINEIITGFKRDKNTVMVLLDVEKAFDKVWIPGLIYKMEKSGYPTYLIKLISSYLSNRTMKVRLNTTLSNTKKIVAGVPQGSVLGPKLFNLYISDLPHFPNTKLSLFADDTAIYAQSYYASAANQLLQTHLNLITNYFKHWKIQINESKTEQIVFSRKYTNKKIFNPLKVNKTPVHPKPQIKYLGLHLDQRLSLQGHIKATLQKVDNAIRTLYPLLKKHNHLSIKNKKLLYTTVLRPIITYAAPIWYSTSTSAQIPLQRIQNKILRLITNSDRYTTIASLHAQTNLPTLSDYTKHLSTIFYENTTHNTNPLIKNITKTRSTNNSIPKHKLLHQKLPIYNQTFQ